MVMDPESDEAIALRVQRGDVEAFSTLVSRYQSRLERYARKFIRDADEGKDVVQEAFIKAFENIQGFDASRRFSPWLYRIAHNELVNALKKKARGPVFGIDLDVVFPYLTANEMADERALENDLRRELDRYLEKLDPKYREPLVLYYFEELSYKDMADILQIPTSTVGVRIARGKALLRKLAHNQTL